MAQRCPGSVFKGKATLPGHKWQINELGVANVLEATPTSSVEGLLYLISPADEKVLDLSEGVSKGFYQKYILKVNFKPQSQYSNFKTAQLAHLLSQQITSPGETVDQVCQLPPTSNNSQTSPPNKAEGSGQSSPSPITQVKALVYVSEDYKTDGTIREEYIFRMQKAAADAITLGISRSFVDEHIMPHLHDNVPPAAAPSQFIQEDPVSGGVEISTETHTTEPIDRIGSHNVSDASSVEKGDNRETEETKETMAQELHINQLEASPSQRLDLSILKHENLQAYKDLGNSLPATLLASITGITYSGSDDPNVIYVVAVHREIPVPGPSFSIEATTHDLQLANEVAMKNFHGACFRVLELQRELSECTDEPSRETMRRIDINGGPDEINRLHLRISAPKSGNHIAVSVMPKDILVAA